MLLAKLNPSKDTVTYKETGVQFEGDSAKNLALNRLVSP